MTQLYNLRSTNDAGEFVITKFDNDYNVQAVYVVSKSACSGPDGHRPKCKHREMLGRFLANGHVDDGYFFDWDTRQWREPLVNPGPMADDFTLDNTIPSQPPILGLSPDEELARKLAPAHESEGSALVRVSSGGFIRDQLEAQVAKPSIICGTDASVWKDEDVQAAVSNLTAAAPPLPAPVNAPPAKAGAASPAGGAAKFTLLKVKL
jgi:hypothetical protein